jgi:hypothetical protein
MKYTKETKHEQAKNERENPQNPTNSRDTKTHSPNPSPAKSTLDYITSIVLLPLPRLERTPLTSNILPLSTRY